MFRDSLAPERGMLFIHGASRANTLLDVPGEDSAGHLWMDRDHTVVEIAENAPPCTSASASECANYGGTRRACLCSSCPAEARSQQHLKSADTSAVF